MKAHLQSKTFLWTVFTLSLFIYIPLLALIQKKMSGDGTLYASIAWNMAHGIGSLWHPVYTKTVFPEFYEHPPLGMYVMSFFFRLFGDYFLVDRLYCFATWFLSLFAMTLIWKELQPKASRQLWYLPVICWMIIPLTTSTFCANAIEDLLVVLTTFSAWAAIRASQQPKLSSVYLLLSGILITAAFFSNGLQAFFPLAIPLIYQIVFKKSSTLVATYHTMALIFFTAITLFAILSYPPAHAFTEHYWNQQVWATLSGHRSGNGNYTGIKHLFGFVLLFANWLPLLLMTGMTMIIARQKINVNKNVIFFVFVGLAASLPILISSRQESHYFLQAFPFLILACIEILTPVAEKSIAKPPLFAVVLFFLSGCITTVYFYGRSPEPLQDVTAISKRIPNGSIISVSPTLSNDWNLHAYFYRYHRISLTETKREPYYLASNHETLYPVGYQRVNLSLHSVILYHMQ